MRDQWWKPFDAHFAEIDQRDTERAAAHDAVFALESQSWFRASAEASL